MNNNAEGSWSPGLIRSYSEHASVVLQHFQQQRHYPDSMKYIRSSSGLYNNDQTAVHSNLNHDDDTSNFGYRSWRQLSTPLLENEKRGCNQCCKISDGGCGDSSTLTSELSELSLTEQQALDTIDDSMNVIGLESASLPSIIQNTRATSPADVDNDLSNDYDDGYNNCSEYQLSDESKSGQETRPLTPVVRAYSSSSSLSTATSRQRLNGIPIVRNISYENWVREKKRQLQHRRGEARRAELKRCEEEEMARREQEAKQLQEYECFLDWVKRKKREKVFRQQLLEKELELERKLHDVEQKAQVVKSMGLLQWRKNKEKQQKASVKEELMRQKKAEEEKERRIQESLKAYEKWREKSKNTPRPATQGLLPHQKAKPAFTNPTPWKSLLDSVSDDSENATQSKTSDRVVKNQRSKRICVKR